LRIHSFDDYVIEKKIDSDTDLPNLIGGKAFIKEERIMLKSLGNYSLRIEAINDEVRSPVTVQHNDSSLPRVLVFRDSFFSQVAPFLADHFECSRYYWKYWNSLTPIEEMLSITKPDIVIEEIVERRITSGMADFVGTPPKFMDHSH